MNRTHARMHLFERCAALLLAELDARESGDRLGAEALRAERDALRTAWEDLGGAGAPATADQPAGTSAEATTFAEALDGAATELAHREAVDAALRERLAALGAAAARAMPAGARSRAALPPGRAPGVFRDPPAATHALDVTF
jgi:hypothetical protein